MADIIELKIPPIGSSNVNVAEVYVAVGDKISIDDNLLMLETDKASMEVPATSGGMVKEVLIKVGASVNEGDAILRLELDSNVNSHNETQNKIDNKTVATLDKPINNEVASSNANNDATVPAVVTESSFKEAAIDDNLFVKAFASPSIRKLARELGANLANIKGSGNKGRITESDVKSYIKSCMKDGATNKHITGNLDILPWPKVDFAKYGDIEAIALSRIKKISGANLARKWVVIPHVTQFDETDITDMEDFRKQLNEEYKKSEIKISPLAFLIKACVFALIKFPEFNSSLEGDNLIYKKYYNIGFAADTPQGLIVPVLKGANSKGVVDIAIEVSNLAKLARDGKLKPTDMQGGTFTISSLGGIGGTAFTPIINAPEVAILGVSKSTIKPIFNGKEFTPRLMMPLSLSYDHRIIDGALAAKFTNYLSLVLSDIRRLTL